jgi:hypothetical protein
MRSRIQGNAAHAGLDRWEFLVGQRQVGALVDQMLSSDSSSVALRQTSPFLGVLSEQERQAAIERAVR